MVMKLASGLELQRADQVFDVFVGQEHEKYDGIKADTDSVLRPEEIAISILVNSQISGNTAREIWEKRGPVEAALALLIFAEEKESQAAPRRSRRPRRKPLRDG